MSALPECVYEGPEGQRAQVTTPLGGFDTVAALVTKLTALFLLVLFAGLVLHLWRKKAAVVPLVATVGVVTLVIAAPYFWSNYSRFGDPLSPLTSFANSATSARNTSCQMCESNPKREQATCLNISCPFMLFSFIPTATNLELKYS